MRSMKKAIVTAGLSIACLSMVALSPTAALASPAPQSSTTQQSQQLAEEAQAVQANYLAGTVTAADEAWVAAHPDLAAYIVDPSKTVIRAATESEVAHARLAAGCTAVNAFGGDEYGLGGLHLYTYVSAVSHCSNSTRVTSVPDRYAYFQSMAPGIVVNDNMKRNDLSYSSPNAYVTHQGQAQWCTAPVGCVFTYNPKVAWVLNPWASDQYTFTP